MQTREIRLERYPDGLPTSDHFNLVSVDLPEPQDGEVLVRNRFMSVDPYMRGRMREGNPYFSPFALGVALDGGCVGEVIASNHPDFEVGDAVTGFYGWREHFVTSGSEVTHVDPDLAPLSTYLGTLGMPGMTAYVGLLDIGRPARLPGSRAAVSSAALVQTRRSPGSATRPVSTPPSTPSQQVISPPNSTAIAPTVLMSTSTMSVVPTLRRPSTA